MATRLSRASFNPGGGRRPERSSRAAVSGRLLLRRRTRPRFRWRSSGASLRRDFWLRSAAPSVPSSLLGGGSVSGTCGIGSCSPWPPPFAPPPPRPVTRPCSAASLLLWRSLTSHARASSASVPHLPDADQSALQPVWPDMRSLRFRRVPSGRDVAFDPRGATASRIAMPPILPSTVPSVSASATFFLSWLNPPPHPITVYASHPPSPTTAQHSLPGSALPPYRGRSFTGRNASASPDAPEPKFLCQLSAS